MIATFLWYLLHRTHFLRFSMIFFGLYGSLIFHFSCVCVCVLFWLFVDQNHEELWDSTFSLLPFLILYIYVYIPILHVWYIICICISNRLLIAVHFQIYYMPCWLRYPCSTNSETLSLFFLRNQSEVWSQKDHIFMRYVLFSWNLEMYPLLRRR